MGLELRYRSSSLARIQMTILKMIYSAFRFIQTSGRGPPRFGAGTPTAEHPCDLSKLWPRSFAFEAAPECCRVQSTKSFRVRLLVKFANESNFNRHQTTPRITYISLIRRNVSSFTAPREIQMRLQNIWNLGSCDITVLVMIS